MSGLKPGIRVIISRQILILNCPDGSAREFPVSTSKYGIGNKAGSNQTPAGKHAIFEKIGQNVPLYGLFRGKEFTGIICSPDTNSSSEDLITTRILVLDGLEPGVNRGKGIDSRQRGIWIHGTIEEYKIGRPASHGCIRMNNLDIIELFDLVECGTTVEIME
ncbi:MAG: L,D-transpeptidase [Candidatus Cloacimonetes bacterium]|nr:L,D-transpeptidase [Candidatus Cloacimonadota bacterium]